MKKVLSIGLMCLFIVGCKKAPVDNGPEILKQWSEWVYEGDSITDINSYSYNYPNQLQNIYGYIAAASQINVAKSGDQINLIVNEYATEIYPHRPLKKGGAIFILMAGINDAGVGRPSNIIYDNLKKEWSYAKADGFTVVAMCITRTTITARDTVDATVNKLILSDHSLYDYVVRTDLLLPNPADVSVFVDGVHPTATGSRIIANEIVRVLSQ